ncbi:MAG: MerR family DNA-binding protein, partial [Gemmatimonadales bacterium]
ADDLRFIRHAQQMGFKLEEVGELLRLRRRVATGGTRGVDAVREAVLAKRNDVVRRLTQLEAVRETLDGLLEACDQMCTGAERPAECPIFEAIDHSETPGSIAPAPRATRSGGRARSANPPPHP